MMTEHGATPTTTRIESLDFLRGCALFGILLMNINGMGLGPAYDNPTIAGGATGANLWTWLIINVGFEGTQRALFSILFGAGVILLTSRLEETGRGDSADIHVRRNLLLVALGIFDAWILLWVGDILYYYGVIALFLYAFRKLPGRTLLAIGVGALLLGAMWSLLDSRRLIALHDKAAVASAVALDKRSPEQKKTIEAWEEKNAAGPPPAVFEQERREVQGDYFATQRNIGPTIKHFESWGLYRDFFDYFGMMIVGMALFRLGVLTLQARTRTYLAMAVAGYAIGLPANIAEARWIMDHGFTGLAYAQAKISYDISRLAMTMGHLGLLLLFLRSGWLAGFRRSMAAVGRMALTNYLTHSLVALIFFVLLGYYGLLQRHQLLFVVFTVWAVQLVASPIWLRHFHFGPVEWVWRALTYGRKPAFRKAT